MAREMPTDAWLEAQVDENSLTVTLMTEGADGATVEETDNVTFDELRNMAGETFTLSLSENSKTILRDAYNDVQRAELFLDNSDDSDDHDLPEVGDIVRDGDPPHWSEDARVKVEAVYPDTRADEHVFNERLFGQDETVADANSDYDPSEPVVEGRYLGGNGGTYAFPASRLVSDE